MLFPLMHAQKAAYKNSNELVLKCSKNADGLAWKALRAQSYCTAMLWELAFRMLWLS